MTAHFHSFHPERDTISFSGTNNLETADHNAIKTEAWLMSKCKNAQTMSWKYIDLNELPSNFPLANYCKKSGKKIAVNLCAALCQWFVSTDAFESTWKGLMHLQLRLERAFALLETHLCLGQSSQSWVLRAVCHRSFLVRRRSDLLP